MSPLLIIACIAVYFLFLLGIAWYTSRNSGDDAYFLGNKASPWYAVAFGMIGDSLSGVTYISVPGAVATQQFSYMQLVLGYFVGYLVISRILLPLYYKRNIISIYSYLEERFGGVTQKTGSFYFILSRTLGAAARLYLAAGVIQIFVFDRITFIHIPFFVSVSMILLLMLLYTYKGGIKTLVWTDTFQSGFLILGVVLCIAAILNQTGWSWSDGLEKINASKYAQIIFTDPLKGNFFLKQFLGGVFIAVAMTGLDQNMMQKNLSMKNLKDAQTNMFWFSVVLVIVNFFFLSLGALLYLYAEHSQIPLPTNEAGQIVSDNVFPLLALNNLGVFASLIFILGLTAATFSSADSVLTTLTTSMYVDMLELDKKDSSEKRKTQIRTSIHIAFAVLLWLIIVLFRAINSKAVIDTVLIIAAYTYGPLLGLFTYGIFNKRKVQDQWVPIVCLLAPLFTWLVSSNSKELLGGYQFGNELILLNALFTIAGLQLISRKE